MTLYKIVLTREIEIKYFKIEESPENRVPRRQHHRISLPTLSF